VTAADSDRLVFQSGIVALLDRRVEGIHVDMEDLAAGADFDGVHSAVLMRSHFPH
jgi:hypothetical protein